MKKWAKFLCCFVLLGAFLVGGLAGCATVSNIKNNNKELIYNGNAATLVEAGNDKFVYFANAFSSAAPTSEDEYSSAKKNSYLARVNGSNLQAKNEYFSPKNVENVSEEVVGYDNAFMFVLGQNIYYATPNRQMVTIETNEGTDTAYHFEFTCFYKSSLNGDNKKKLYTTAGEVSQIEVLKSGETYYIVMLAGDDLVAINLSNDKAQTLATGVTSVALPKTFRKDVGGSTLDWDGQIYFSTTKNNGGGSGATINLVKKIAVSSTNQEDAEEIYNQGSIEFIAREENVVFFVGKSGNDQKIYMLDLGKSGFSGVWTTVFESESVSSASVESINAVKMKVSGGYVLQGYVFKAGSDFKYVTKAGKIGTLSLGDVSGANILFASGMTVFLASDTGIYRADLSSAFLAGETNIQCQTIVDEMDGIQSGTAFAFDGVYVYFYSTLQEVPEELKDEDEEETEETDSNLYLHRAVATRTNEFELLGKTAIQSRRTK